MALRATRGCRIAPIEAHPARRMTGVAGEFAAFRAGGAAGPDFNNIRRRARPLTPDKRWQ